LKVIGIDPGLTATGYGIIEDGNFISAGTIRSKEKKGCDKILDICTKIKQLLHDNKPDIAVLEKVFYHKNVQSLIKSSELRGAIILTLLENNMPLAEYTATKIKLTTTGNGRASKEQVRYFIGKILVSENSRISNHATDALAIAYTATRKMKQTI
jgi:crossover junction endodeoxyribonuclease RuvC